MTPEPRRLPRRRGSGPSPLRVPALALAGTLAAVGCGGGGDGGRSAATPAPATVDIKLYAFAPGDVTVAVGQPVTWVERDEDLEGKGAHSVVADDATFDSGLIRQDAAFTFTPVKAGVVSYYCGVHNYMKGTVTVR